MLKRIGMLLLGFLFVGMLVACDKDESTKKEVVKPVKTMVIKPSSGTITRHFPGKVLASKEAILSFLVSAQLIQMPVLEGQDV